MRGLCRSPRPLDCLRDLLSAERRAAEEPQRADDRIDRTCPEPAFDQVKTVGPHIFDPELVRRSAVEGAEIGGAEGGQRRLSGGGLSGTEAYGEQE